MEVLLDYMISWKPKHASNDTRWSNNRKNIGWYSYIEWADFFWKSISTFSHRVKRLGEIETVCRYYERTKSPSWKNTNKLYLSMNKYRWMTMADRAVKIWLSNSTPIKYNMNKHWMTMWEVIDIYKKYWRKAFLKNTINGSRKRSKKIKLIDSNMEEFVFENAKSASLATPLKRHDIYNRVWTWRYFKWYIIEYIN